MPQWDDAKGLVGFLREQGFEGGAPTFRRFVGKDFVALVNLQASAGEVYVNLGAHYRWLGKPPSWDDIREYDCAFRARLVDFAGSQRFSLKDAASVTALLEMMKREGLLFFSQLEPDQVVKTAKALARDGYDRFAPLGTPADAATWAKLATHFGETALTKRFEAQDAAASRAREAERARARAEEDAEAVEMTLAELRAARKAGRAPKVVRLVLEKKPKKDAKRKSATKKKRAPAKRTRSR